MKLFQGIPNVDRLIADTGIDRGTVEAAVLELAWVTKTITRLGRGFILGDDHGFSRPGSAADAEAIATDPPPSDYPSWVSTDELAFTLADRTGFATDTVDAIIAAVGVQIDEHGGPGLEVARKAFELERIVEDQLIADPSVLTAWGWDFTGEPKRQVRLDAANRADLVGQLADGGWVVVELKRAEALVETANQILRYIPLVRDQFAGGDPVTGLVIADGDNAEFHDRIAETDEAVAYLPTRSLNLPACRPQTHRLPGVSKAATLTVAADGITAVAATDLDVFMAAQPSERRLLGRQMLDGSHKPLPVVPLPLSP